MNAKNAKRLTPTTEPMTQRAITRDELQTLTWMQSVWVRDLTDGELIEGRVKGFNPPWVNVLFPSGEVASFEYDDTDADAVSDGGRYLLVAEGQ